MSIALSEFWTRLVRGGIADAADCKRMAKAYADAQGTPASDAGQLAEFLVRTDELTEYQSRCVLSDSHAAIRFGDFVRRTDIITAPLSHWLSVQAVADRRIGYLIRVGGNQYSENRRQWLEAHASVTAPTLQPFELHGSPATGIVDVFSELADGRCLSEITTDKMRVDKRQALTVGIAVADALTAMHGRSLVHGAVRADRIWLTSAGQPILLRDPSGPPAPPRQDQSAAWIDVVESPGGYAAPEFADPACACNSLTDIYSLGCLLFRMVVGRMPFSGPTIEAEIAAHVCEAPLELSEALAQGEAGDPVLRVIAYVMAKSPAARFATAQQVSDALKAVMAILDEGEASKSKIRAATPKRQSQPAVTPPPVAPRPTGTEVPSTSETVKPKQPAVIKPPREQKAPLVEPPRAPARAEKPSPTKRPQPPEPKTDKERPGPPRRPAVPKSKSVTAAKITPPAREPKEKPADEERREPPREKRAANKPAAPTPSSTPIDTAKDRGDSDQSVRKPATAEAAKTVTPPAPPDRATPPPAPQITAKESAAGRDASSDERPTRRRRRKKKSKIPFVFAILSVPVLLLVIGLIAQGSRGGKKKSDGTRPTINPDRVPTVGQARRVQQTPPKETPTNGTAAAPGGYQLVNDDQLLWVPPYAADTDNAPLDLLPPGPAIIVSLRLSKVLGDPVANEMVEALSPEVSTLFDTAAKRAGVSRDAIQRVTAALHTGQDGRPQTSLAIELSRPVELTTLVESWKASSARTPDGFTIYAGDDPGSDAYYLGDSDNGVLPSDASVKRFAVGPLEQIREVAANEGGGIPMSRLLGKLWKMTSVESDLVALITPNFLFADGRELLLGTAPEAVAPLKNALIPDVAGLLITATSNGQDIYAEMGVVPSGDVTEARLLRDISDAFGNLPVWADSFVVDAVPDASWRLLATRLPLMLRFLVEHTRFGESDGAIIANTYLPGNAATQITLGTLLALNTKPGSGGQVGVTTTAVKPLTMDEMLNRKMSIDFDQESLEFGIAAIIDQFSADLPGNSTAPKVRIIGGDLEKGGITQNQQIRDFSKTDLPLRTVLTDLLLGANPDKTATGPKDSKQALVWVVSPDGSEILVTTRAASEGVYELPAEFKPDE